MAYTVSKGWLDGVRRKPAVDIGGTLARREYGVIHYTAGVGFAGAQATLTTKDDRFASAHLLLGREPGQLAQLVSFDRIAYHAGKSAWEGKTGLNSCSIGIEIVNPGWYEAGKPVEWPMARAAHRNGGKILDWYAYPDEQIAALVELIIGLRDTLGIRKWVGHDHIAPGRKFDPGPAFPWPRIAAIPGILAPTK